MLETGAFTQLTIKGHYHFTDTPLNISTSKISIQKSLLYKSFDKPTNEFLNHAEISIGHKPTAWTLSTILSTNIYAGFRFVHPYRINIHDLECSKCQPRRQPIRVELLFRGVTIFSLIVDSVSVKGLGGVCEEFSSATQTMECAAAYIKNKQETYWDISTSCCETCYLLTVKQSITQLNLHMFVFAHGALT